MSQIKNKISPPSKSVIVGSDELKANKQNSQKGRINHISQQYCSISCPTVCFPVT